MRRLFFTLLVFGLTLGAFSSIFLVWGAGLLPPISGGIIESQRFSSVMKNENTVAWFNGHIHSEHHLEGTRVDKWGTVFIDDGSITDKPESLFLIFENGSEKVIVKSRNHEEGKWNNLENKLSFYLNHPFELPANWNKDNLIIWMWSDSQPVEEKDWKNLEKVIEDVDNQKMQPDMALVLGDIVDHGAIEDYKKMRNYLDNSKLPIENFYELAGNHDFGPYFTGTHKNYQQKLENDLKYTVKRGNVLFILMSDEHQGATGFLSDNTFNWWKDIVKDKQKNNNIITLTHQPIQGTTRGSEASILSFLKSNLFVVLPIIIPLGMSIIIAYESSS